MQRIYTLPVLVWFVELLLLRLGGSALGGLGRLTPETTEVAILFPLCGGMGTGTLGGAGARGSIVLGFVGLDSTKEMKQHCQKAAQHDAVMTQDYRRGFFMSKTQLNP